MVLKKDHTSVTQFYYTTLDNILVKRRRDDAFPQRHQLRCVYNNGKCFSVSLAERRPRGSPAIHKRIYGKYTAQIGVQWHDGKPTL